MAGFFDGAFGGITSGVGGIISSIFGNKAQRDANAANLRIAQMNNEWSERMMEKQNNYNLAQWNREKEFALEQREYDSAKNQAARLREAGLNPALAMGGNNAGSAASTPNGSSVGMPSPSSATIQPVSYNGFTDAVNNALQMVLLTNKNNADISNSTKTTDANIALIKAQMAKLYEETRNEKVRANIAEATESMDINIKTEDWLKKIQERSNMEEQQKLIKEQRIAQTLVNQNLPDKLAMEVAVLASTKEFNEFNSQHDVGKLVSTLKKKGYKLSKAQEDAIFESVITALENDAWKTNSPWSLVGQSIAAAKRYKTKYQEYVE